MAAEKRKKTLIDINSLSHLTKFQPRRWDFCRPAVKGPLLAVFVCLESPPLKSLTHSEAERSEGSKGRDLG